MYRHDSSAWHFPKGVLYRMETSDPARDQCLRIVETAFQAGILPKVHVISWEDGDYADIRNGGQENFNGTL